jgi:DNA-binding IclR family transcriptional regulator
VTDRRRLAAEIADAQDQGYVMSVGQHIPLAAGVAAPFRLPSGLVGAVSITRSRYETDDADLNRFAPLAVATAQQITDLSADHHPEPLRPHIRDTGDAPGGALSRIINLIETLVAHPDGLTATNRDLARRLGARPPTTQRLRASALLSGLTAARQADELFPGPLLLKWAAILGPHVDLNAVVQPEIDQLSTETGETIGYVRYDPATATANMCAVDSNNGNPLTYGLGADVTIPLYAGAAGKAILAHCPQDVIDSQKLEPINPHTVIDPDQLHAELDMIRQHGYATADGERIPDAYGLAAPVFTNGTVSGSVTISIPSYRVAQADLPTLATALTATTGRLSWLLTTTD